jgi:hypothetical protein|tara:strand:+ start:5039 stop:5461 length:423 start_codon:yes stop_codon:yes gene_type:complete
MIKYKLYCKNCSKNFESWFASSKEFEKLKKSRLLNCLYCNSYKIEKSLMAPSIINKQNKNNLDSKKFTKIKNKLKKYKKFIQNNFDYVGDNFAYEVRSIHYNHKKREKGIYGKASVNEVKELSEEGIEVGTIPWVNDKEN